MAGQGKNQGDWAGGGKGAGPGGGAQAQQQAQYPSQTATKPLSREDLNYKIQRNIAAGAVASRRPGESIDDAAKRWSAVLGVSRPPSYKRGGVVRETGLAEVHEGERVLTKRQNRRYQSRGASRR